MRITTLKIFIIFYSLSLFPLILLAQGTSGSWVPLSNTGFTARKGLASAVVNGKIYTIAGIGYNGTTHTFINTLEVFDPVSNSWNTPKTTGTATARYQLTAAAVNGKIYVIGGTNSADLSLVEEFDPVSNTWTTLTTTGTFTARHALTSSVVGNKIYVIGGASNLGPLNTVEVFDPATNTWSTPTTTGTFTPATELTSSVIGDKIYVMGGYDGSSTLNTLQVLDASTNAWSTPTTTGTFTPRDNLSSSALDGKIYVMGGFQDGESLNTVEVFDPATNQWITPVTNGSFSARSELTSATVDGQIYAIGGINLTIDSFMQTIEVFRPLGNDVKAAQGNSDIQLSPNPTTGLISVLNPEASTEYVTVTNILGEKITEFANSNTAQFGLDLSKFSPGTYYVRFASSHSVITKMVIRE